MGYAERVVMSTTYKANQFDTAFRPKALCNWEVSGQQSPGPGGARQKLGSTGRDLSFICDDRGHLKPDVAKCEQTATVSSDTIRWPTSPLAPRVPSPTVGYKGIQTSYLPTSTVHLRNNPGSAEFNYH